MYQQQTKKQIHDILIRCKGGAHQQSDKKKKQQRLRQQEATDYLKYYQ
jgi:hypothetical protein